MGQTPYKAPGRIFKGTDFVQMGKPDLNGPTSKDIASMETKVKKEEISTIWQLGGKEEKKKVEILEAWKTKENCKKSWDSQLFCYQQTIETNSLVMYLDFDRVAEKDAIKLEMWITPQFHKSKQSGL